jgi:predicted metalloprotease with PDZ domain
MGSGSGGFGSLLHYTSTVCVLPEAPVAALAQTIRDVVAHEFFHIVTPLNIHSEQIDDFDFMNPEMSAHLWLYEGCTEYAAQHMQVKQGLMPMDEFLSVIRQKMAAASQFDSGIAFTELSKKALDEHEDQYLNVYQQGALIGMALDLKLLHLSQGKYDLQMLLADLSEEYGETKPFQDDLLFEEIGRISNFPETTEFLQRYIDGTTPIPFDTLLGYAGIEYAARKTGLEITGGGVAIGYNPRTERMVIVSVDQMDEFGKAMGFVRGDEIINWNGMEVDKDNFRTILDEYKSTVSPGDKVKVVVARKQEDRSYKEVKLKAKAIEVEKERTNVLRIMDNPSQEQLNIRSAWINQ